MSISNLVYDSWMKESQFRKYSGMMPMLKKVDLAGKVLDVGIGTALFEEFLKGQSIHLDVKGLEIDRRMLETARKKGYDVAFGSAEELPFQNDSFDFVICIDTIHAVYDKDKAMREIKRVLKPGKAALIAHFCNVFTKSQVIRKLENLTSDFEVVAAKIVGNADDELSVAFLVKNGE